MNRRQMFKALLATAVATVLPLPAIKAWKDRLSDIMSRTLQDPAMQRRIADNVMQSNSILIRMRNGSSIRFQRDPADRST